MIEQINNYYKAKEYVLPKCNYSIGDDVRLYFGEGLYVTLKNYSKNFHFLKTSVILTLRSV